MKVIRGNFVFVVLMLFSLPILADTLVLKDGNVLQGTFKGGTAEALQFEVNGKVETVALGEITSLTLSPRESKTTATAQPAPAVEPVPQSAPVAEATVATAQVAAEPAPQVSSTGATTLPAGSQLMLKTRDTISTASHGQGSKFTAVLENDLVANGKVVAPKGTVVYGSVLESVGGRAVGGMRLRVTFSDLSLNNQLVPIVTDDVGAEGGRGGTAKAVGAGALIGAAAGDSGTGAAIGGAAALLASGGRHIQVPAGTLVQVSLRQPVTIQ